MVELSYSIPNVGPVRVQLYPPADELYSLLEGAGEVQRLRQLRHIGALAHAFPGVPHTRWDYTVSMLYVVTRLRRLVSNSNFRLGGAKFSSARAALQCLALLSNIGHLPGTYSVEKGVARFLHSHDAKQPLNPLFDATCAGENRRHRKKCDYPRTLKSANDIFQDKAYLVLSRLLGLLKLLGNFRGNANVSNWMPWNLYAPFILSELRSDDRQWAEIDQYFDIVRRLAYLNQDTALVDSPITVGLSPLLSNLVDPDGLTSETVTQSREILSAYEHTVYERFYHHPEARKVSAVAASLVIRRLEADDQPIHSILNWMYNDHLDIAIDTEQLDHLAGNATLIGSIATRNFIFTIPKTISEVEIDLHGAISSECDDVAVVAHKYEPPESQHTLEPEHLHLDAYAFRRLRVKDVGCFAKWAAELGGGQGR